MSEKNEALQNEEDNEFYLNNDNLNPQDAVSENDDNSNEADISFSETSEEQSGSIDELASAKQEINKLKEELANTKDAALRALAEADNLRKRTAKEKSDLSKYAVSSFAKDMLSVADNMRRGIESIPADLRQENEQIANTIVGMEAVERTLLQIFERNGIKKTDPLGEQFDPNFHEVMFQSPVAGKPAGTIIQVIEPGYILHERLLRPARVGISSGEPEQQSENADNNSKAQHIDTEA